MVSSYLSNDFDKNLEEVVKSSGWLPFVGSNFPDLLNEQKVLLIGESNYFYDENTKRNTSDKNFVRKNVLYYATHPTKKKRNDFFENINLLFSITNRIQFWSKVCYNVIVPRTMDWTNGNREKPSNSDFLDGWDLIHKQIDILKPDHCLFIGLKAADTFNTFCRDNGISHQIVDKFQDLTINHTSFGRATMSNVPIYFIAHPSNRRGFNPKAWAVLLRNIAPNLYFSITEIKSRNIKTDITDDLAQLF